MKRAHGHLAFALVASALVVLTAGEALRLQHAQRINSAVAEWTTAPVPDPRVAPAKPGATAGNPETAAGNLQPTAANPQATAATPHAAAAGTPNANPAATSSK